MHISIVTPAPPHSRKGNRITALRWARLLRDLGHRVSIDQEFRRQRCEVLIALHSRRSHSSIRRFAEQRPDAPLIVALTGTDLFGDLSTSQEARESLELATHLILLQPSGTANLPSHVRSKARVIYQSVKRSKQAVGQRKGVFEVCVMGHLREVKDPFRTAMAARLLPVSSRIRVVHLGAALTPDMERRAVEEARSNARYQWLGELPRWKALRVLSRCRLLSLTSQMEGGANVISEACVAAIPIVSSRIPGSVGLLGEDYSGYFPTGDTEALARLLEYAETDTSFYRSLVSGCERIAPLFEPSRERQSWKMLLGELAT